MIDLKEIKRLVLSGKTLEEALEKVDWKDFEETVAEIFRANGFKVRRNVRLKGGKRYEVDIIASKNDTSFCVDCKRWSGRRYKKSQLKLAAKKQKERVEYVKSLLKTIKIYPMIVTLLQEDLVEEDGVYIVPVWKLNTFLLESNL